MIGDVSRLTEAQAAQQIRTLCGDEPVLILYKHKDFARIQKWRKREGLEDLTEVFVVPTDEWSEMKNMYVITGHDGPKVIFYTGEITPDSFNGILWRELQTLGEEIPVWVIA